MTIVPFDHAQFELNEVQVQDVSIDYTQDADCTEEAETQFIHLESRNNGTARFVCIKTEEWSINNPKELVDLIKDFCQRAGIDLED